MLKREHTLFTRRGHERKCRDIVFLILQHRLYRYTNEVFFLEMRKRARIGDAKAFWNSSKHLANTSDRIYSRDTYVSWWVIGIVVRSLLIGWSGSKYIEHVMQSQTMWSWREAILETWQYLMNRESFQLFFFLLSVSVDQVSYSQHPRARFSSPFVC